MTKLETFRNLPSPNYVQMMARHLVLLQGQADKLKCKLQAVGMELSMPTVASLHLVTEAFIAAKERIPGSARPCRNHRL